MKHLAILTILAAVVGAVGCYDDATRERPTYTPPAASEQETAPLETELAQRREPGAAERTGVIEGTLVVDDAAAGTFHVEPSAPVPGQHQADPPQRTKRLEAPDGTDLDALDGKQVEVRIEDGTVRDITPR